MDTGMGTENIHSKKEEVKHWDDPYTDKMYEYAEKSKEELLDVTNKKVSG